MSILKFQPNPITRSEDTFICEHTKIFMFDFSQNQLHMQGRGFEPTKKILKNELFHVLKVIFSA